MHEILVYAGATASLEADNRYRRLASASLHFCAESRIEPEAFESAGAHGSQSHNDSINYSSDHTSIVADSFPRPTLPANKSEQTTDDHTDHHSQSMTGLELVSTEKAVIPVKTLDQMFFFSRSQFELHENNARYTDRISKHKHMVPADEAERFVENKQDVFGEASSRMNKTRAVNAVALEADVTAVMEPPRGIGPRGPARSSAVPETLLDAVALRAQKALGIRNAELQAVRDASRGRTSRTIQVHFQRPAQGNPTSSCDDDVSILLKTPSSEACHSHRPIHNRTGLLHTVTTMPDSVDRFITIATDKDQGSTATPISEGHTTSDSNTKGLSGTSETPENSSFGGSLSQRVGNGSASQTFLVKQSESPFYQSTSSIRCSVKAASLPDATTPTQKFSDARNFSLCVAKHYRRGTELLHATIVSEHSTPFDHEPDFLNLFRPMRTLKSIRELGANERGYWSLNLSDLGFKLEEATDLWNQFATILNREKLYWISMQYTENTFRVYCYVHCMLKVWALLYSLSPRKLLKKSIPWIDAAGHKLALYP